MNHRQRILTALRHEEPDRLPIDLGATFVTGMMAPAYRKVRRALGLPARPVRIADMLQQLAEIEPDVLDRFGVDAVGLDNTSFDPDGGASFWKPYPENEEGEALIPRSVEVVQDEGRRYLSFPPRERVAVRPLDCPYFENIWRPLTEAESVSDLDRVDWEAWGAKDISGLKRRALRLRETTDRCLLAGFGGQMLEAGQDFMGYEKYMMELAMDSPLANAFLDRLMQIYERNLDAFIEHLAPSIDVICFFDDLGSQHAPQISLAMFRKFFLPRYRRLFMRVKEKTSCFTFLHCCGAIRPFIPDLIEAGLDILNPVQVSAAGMNPVELKREFGKDLTFWGGGCDTQRILPTETPERVRDDVREKIDALAPGGGFVFTPVHNIQADIPPENIIALYDEALRFRYE